MEMWISSTGLLYSRLPNTPKHDHSAPWQQHPSNIQTSLLSLKPDVLDVNNFYVQIKQIDI